MYDNFKIETKEMIKMKRNQRLETIKQKYKSWNVHGKESSIKQTPFQINEELNSKIYLVSENICEMNVDGIASYGQISGIEFP